MIIDASVGSKWILQGEPDEERALVILNNHIVKKEIVIVPDLFFYEIANTLATKTGIPPLKIKNSLRVLYKAQLSIEHSDEALIQESCALAKKLKTSVYDMVYALIAKKYNTKLVTADEKFLKLTKLPFVKLLSEFDSS